MDTQDSRVAALAIVGLAVLPACLAGKPEPLSIDRQDFALPARPVILFFVDGLRADVLEELDSRGELPRLRHYLFDRAARVRSAVASVPSVTYANAVTLLTGCWPSTHGIWGNATFDRRQLVTRNYEAERELAVADAARDTIFELLSDDLTAGIAMPFERGVKISRAKSAETGGTTFGLTWVMGREQAADERLSEQLHDIAEQAREIGEWPAFIAIHLPGVDNVGHEHGSDGREYRDAVANLDEVIGEVLEAFERSGMLEELTLVLTSDHGHHTAPDTLVLDDAVEAALGGPALVTLENDADVPFLERWERYASARVVVVPNGVREASLHLRTTECWSDRPSLEEILAFPASPDAPPALSLPDRLLQCPAIDLVAVRAGAHEVRVHGRPGVAGIRRTSGAAEPSFDYAILSGRDPLRYDADPRLKAWTEKGAHASREWLAATADERYPDAVPQLVLAFEDAASGDIALFAAPGWDFSEDYVGDHGGLEREEMIVPLYLAGPGIRAGAELPAARLVDVVPTLVDLAGLPPDALPRFDGISLVEMLR